MEPSSAIGESLESAIFLYGKREDAEAGVDLLMEHQYVIEDIPTEPIFVPINGPLVGWCVRKRAEAQDPEFAWSSLKTFFANPEHPIDPHLHAFGIPRDDLLRQRASMNPDRHLIIVHGGASFVKEVVQLLQPTDIQQAAYYTISAADPLETW